MSITVRLAESITVRLAEREDVRALVRLRLANAEQHIRLDPAVYRLPDAESVVGSGSI